MSNAAADSRSSRATVSKGRLAAFLRSNLRKAMCRVPQAGNIQDIHLVMDNSRQRQGGHNRNPPSPAATSASAVSVS